MNRASIDLTHSTSWMYYLPYEGDSTGFTGDTMTFTNISNSMEIADPTVYTVKGSDTLASAVAILYPSNNSYVSGPVQEHQLIYGNGMSSDGLNLIRGMYHHSDNLQNWTQNLAQALTNRLAELSPATDYEYSAVKNQTHESHFKIRWCELSSLPPCIRS